MSQVSIGLFKAVFNHMTHRVGYLLGAKAPYNDCDSSLIRSIDCSGFSLYAVYRASVGTILMPHGSQNQHAWAEKQGFHKLAEYSDVLYAKDDPGRLFICFMGVQTDGHGHVWLVGSDGKGNMVTYESHAGVGVSSRPWDTSVLKLNCNAAYELPCKA